ncbi:MAG TPA: NeuD/PglB/VioB family sugar acetyltransferase [Chryseolinea sp.]|nr:NeuD/PglB/VioB family sugar acetyltransferase [Chryseolinea sp.]
MENPVIIFGASYLGRQAKDILENNGNVIYCFLDDNKKLHNTIIDEITVMGSTDDDDYLKLIGKKCDAVVAIDDNKVRKSVVTILQEERHAQPVNVISKLAFVAGSAVIGHGNILDHQVTIGAGATVGNHTILQAGCIVGPEVKIGDFVQIGAGSIVNAGCEIANEAFIGTGVTVVGGVSIGKGARIGAGSVVIASVKAGDTVFGNPAQSVKS